LRSANLTRSDSQELSHERARECDARRRDVHALANPHFMSDPIIAKQLLNTSRIIFCRRCANAGFYEANYKKFEAAINAKLQEWGAAMLPFKGQSVVPITTRGHISPHRFGLNIRYLS